MGREKRSEKKKKKKKGERHACLPFVLLVLPPASNKPRKTKDDAQKTNAKRPPNEIGIGPHILGSTPATKKVVASRLNQTIKKIYSQGVVVARVATSPNTRTSSNIKPWHRRGADANSQKKRKKVKSAVFISSPVCSGTMQKTHKNRKENRSFCFLFLLLIDGGGCGPLSSSWRPPRFFGGGGLPAGDRIAHGRLPKGRSPRPCGR